MSFFVGCEQNGSGWRRSFDGTVKSNSKRYAAAHTNRSKIGQLAQRATYAL
jgi:hypothetical protein